MKVKAVRYAGKANVYNLEVKDTHDYIGNGVVVHNCYDSTRYFMMARPAPMRSEEIETRKTFDPYRRGK